MSSKLIAHDLRTHTEDTLLTADELRIVRLVRRWWPGMDEVPIHEWFIPSPLVGKKYMITNV